MKKKKLNLGEEIRQCGYLTNISDRLQPNNDAYNAISSAIARCDYPVLPVAEEGEIAQNKAFTVDLKDILLTDGESVNDSICAVMDAKGDMLGDLHGAFQRSDSYKIREYYLDTALCYGINKKTGKSTLLTSSEIMLQEIPIIGTNNTLKHVENIWLDFDLYTIYRLFPRAEGYYVIKKQINISHYYICPLTYILQYMAAFKKLAKDNVLLLYFIAEGEDKVIKCTLCNSKVENKFANYLNMSAEKIGAVRVYDIENKKIVAIPVTNIISFIVLQSLK